MDVKALTLIHAQVQILQTSNKADLYLLTRTNSFSVSLHPDPGSAATQTPGSNSGSTNLKSEFIGNADLFIRWEILESYVTLMEIR